MLKKKLYINLKTAFALPFIVLIVSPITFYLGNRDVIEFYILDVFPQSIVISILISGLFFIILWFGRKHTSFYQIFSGLLLGLAFSAWVQSQLFVWKFGLFDGSTIDWAKWQNHAFIEALIWVVIIIFCVYIFIKKPNISKKLINTLLIFGLISISAYILTAPNKNIKNKDVQDVFSFHPDNNVVIIILDTFQSDYFEKIHELYPEETNFLSDFTFYRNTISNYPTTKPTIPAVLYRKLYKNEIPFTDYIDSAKNEFDLVEELSVNSYNVKLIGTVHPASVSMESVIEKTSLDPKNSWLSFFDYGLFRVSPTFLKPNIYNNGNWFLSFLCRGKYPPDHHGTDIRFLEAFESNSNIENMNYKGAVRLYHFHIPHYPLNVNEELEFDPNLIGEEGYIKQARGALYLSKRIINKLIELDLYKSAEIFIISDTGTNNLRSFYYQENQKIPYQVISSSLSLFLHKPANSNKSELTINDSQLYLTDLACFLHQRISDINCTEFEEALKGKQRERQFFYYNWEHKYWDEDFLPQIKQYFLTGHAYDPFSWDFGDFIFMPEQKSSTIPLLKNDDTIDFSAEGNSENFLLFGFSGQENNFRWTDGNIAGIKFKINKFPENGLTLEIDGQAYLGGGLSHQVVEVMVNGNKIDSWKVNELSKYSAFIPGEIIDNDGIIELEFQISDPTAPCDVSESTDSRQLGFAIYELIINETE